MTPQTLPTVVFAMRYPDDVGLVWAGMARLYDAATGYLLSQARGLVCFPVLTDRPALGTPNLGRVACNWYDTRTPASRVRIREVAAEHRVRLVVYMSGVASELDLTYLRQLGIRTLNIEGDSYPPDTQPWVKRAAKRVLRGWLKRGIHDCYAPNAEHQGRYLVRSVGLPRSRVVTVVNGIDVERFTPGPRPDPNALGLPNTEYYVISVSQARPEKRVDVLIDAAALVFHQQPGLSLTFVHVGAGQCLDVWKTKAEKLGLGERYAFPGESTDVLPYHRLATLFAHAAERESFGFAVAEAMACGKPVVAARSAGPAEVMEEGKTGLLVELGDAGGFARAILRLFEDAELHARMSTAARERAVQLYDVRRQAAELAAVIRRLLNP